MKVGPKESLHEPPEPCCQWLQGSVLSIPQSSSYRLLSMGWTSRFACQLICLNAAGLGRMRARGLRLKFYI